jgi:hypothetical protein
MMYRTHKSGLACLLGVALSGPSIALAQGQGVCAQIRRHARARASSKALLIWELACR